MSGVKGYDSAIKALKPRNREYEVSVREHRGLVVVIYPSGARSFALRYRQDGILKRIRLNAPTLSVARVEWQAHRDQIKSGEDPSAAVRSARVDKQLKRQAERSELTIEQLAEMFIQIYAKKKKKSWRSDELILARNVIPEWGAIKAKEITRRDVVGILDRIADRTPIYANRTLAVIRKMYNWAIEKGYIDTSPCDHVKGPAKEKSRDRVLAPDEIQKLWNDLDKTKMQDQVQVALKLQLITGQRIGEVVGASWSEFDFENREWLIPGARTKNGLENLVPLPAIAIDLIKQLERSGKYLFPARGKSGVLRVDGVTHQLVDAIEQLGMAHFTSHDLRRTAGTGITSVGTSRLVMDAILNHKDRTVGAVYDRYKYYKEKRTGLDAWADKLLKTVNATPKPQHGDQSRKRNRT